MRFVLGLFVFGLLHLSLHAQDRSLRLSLTFPSAMDYEGKVYLVASLEGVVDSAEIHQGKCVLQYQPSAPQLAGLVLEQDKTEFLLFILSPGAIQIEGDLQKWSQSAVSYTDTTDYHLYHEFQQQYARYNSAVALCVRKLREAEQEKDSVTIKEQKEKLTKLGQEERKYIFSFANDHSDSYGMAIAIHEELLPADYLKPEEFQQVYNNYSERLRNSTYGKSLQKHIRQRKEGNPFLNTSMYPFQLPDSTGKIRKLKDFKAKYYLIDIWASWCGPCRAMNVSLKNYYHRYQQQGFEIIGISVDQERNNWTKALQEDQTSWPQLLDKAGILPRYYQIGAYPTNFILDKSGKIISADLYGEELSSKLEELFCSPSQTIKDKQ